MEKIICCIHGCKKEVCQTAYCEEHEEEFNEEEIRKPERKQTIKEVLDLINEEIEKHKELEKNTDDDPLLSNYYWVGLMGLKKEIKKLGDD